MIAFSLFILFKEENIGIKNKLFDELRHIKNPNMENLRELKYTDRVYKELLRFISPANLISRYTSRDLIIGDKTINKGSYMMVSIKSILQDDKHWVNPEKFDPDRKIPDNYLYPFIPFSTGERMCPGVQATEMVFKGFLYFIKDYEFIADPNNPKFFIPECDPVTRLKRVYHGHLRKI